MSEQYDRRQVCNMIRMAKSEGEITYLLTVNEERMRHRIESKLATWKRAADKRRRQLGLNENIS